MKALFQKKQKQPGQLDQEVRRKSGKSRGAGLWKAVWSWWEGLNGPTNWRQQATNYEVYYLSLQEWLWYGALGSGAAAMCAYCFYRNAVVFFLLLPAGFSYPVFHRKVLLDKRKERLNQEFKEGILVLASNLSAGYSIENALDNSSRELILLYGEDGMIAGEFGAMVRQIRMNRPVEQVFSEFADRSGLEDVRNFAQVLRAAKRSGGDLVAIINHTAGVIRDKVQVREEIITMTASKKFEQNIMNLIPFLIIFYIDGTSPGFFEMMYTTGMGRILMTACLGVYVGAIYLSQRILSIPI